MFCSKCKTEMSDNALACPKCGEPTKNAVHSQTKKTSGCAIGCLTVIIIASILGGVGWLLENNSDFANAFSEIAGDASESKDPISQRLISEGLTYIGSERYTEITELYASNEIAAKRDWIGKRVFIKGEFSRLDTDWIGNGIGIIIDIDIVNSVRCHFTNLSKDSAANFRKGQKFIISGKLDCTSLLGVVAMTLSDCTIEE